MKEDEDREELLWRRIADKVAEGADKQIKRRYFLAALLFAVISWFGGVSYITFYVEREVAKRMEPAQEAIVTTKVTADELKESLKDANKSATKLSDTFKEINTKVDDATAKEAKLETKLESAALAMEQYNSRLGLLNAAVTDLSKQSSPTPAVGKLAEQQIVVRIGGDAPPELSKQLLDGIKKLGKSLSVAIVGGRTFVGSSSLRYFYQDDEGTAKDIAGSSTEVLRQLGLYKTIPVVGLTGQEIKPPEHSFELWLNFSGGKLL